MVFTSIHRVFAGCRGVFSSSPTRSLPLSLPLLNKNKGRVDSATRKRKAVVQAGSIHRHPLPPLAKKVRPRRKIRSPSCRRFVFGLGVGESYVQQKLKKKSGRVG